MKLKTIMVLMLLFWATVQSSFAQVFDTPDDYVDPRNVDALSNAVTALITILVGYFSALIPGLKNISNKAVRIIVTSLVVVAGAGAFKFGFLTKETFEFALLAFLPNFGGSAFVYEVLKFLLGLVGVKIKTLQPETVAKE